MAFHDEVRSMLDEMGVPYTENVEQGAFNLGSNEVRRLICTALLQSIPKLKQLVRSYSSQSIVAGPDYKVAIGIWKSLDSIEDATEKLSQSEF